MKGHPYIVQGIDYIPEFLRSRGYLVMELVSGTSLLNYVYEKGPIDEKKAKEIIRNVINGV